MFSWLLIPVLLVLTVGLTTGHQNRGSQQAFGVNSNEPHIHNAPNAQQKQQYQTGSQQQGGGGGVGSQFQGSGQPGGGSQFQGGHDHQQPAGVFDKSQIQDREHIKEHLDGVAQADTSKMTDQELQFHYFKMHDSDNNNKLDGSELIKSLIHWHVTEENHPNNPNRPTDGPKVFDDKELEVLIDPILHSDDTNRDGFIDYTEFSAAQARIAANQGNQPQQQQH